MHCRAVLVLLRLLAPESCPLAHPCPTTRSIYWLGGRAAFPEWTLGNIGLFFGNEGEYAQEFYCSLGIVAEVPAYADRPTLQAAQLAWAGRRE